MSQGIPGLDDLLTKLKKAKSALDRELNGALLKAGLVVAGQAQRNVSGPRPDRLGVVTNRLRSSISAVLVANGRVKVGTNVVYAAIHEYGGRTKPHLIRPRKAKALSWQGEGGEIFTRRSVNHPGSVIPARPYLHPALESRRAQALQIIRKVYAGPLMLGGRLS
jgi:HK97 gp10 family phage protein